MTDAPHIPVLLDEVIEALDPQPGDAVIEIGPGLGALTLPLLARLGALTAVEIDRDLHEPLRARALVHGALLRDDGRSTLLVEWGDFYNEK